MHWKSHFLEAQRLESMTYNSLRASTTNCAVDVSAQDMQHLILIDEGLIRVHAESAVALEGRLDKQI